MPEPTSEQDMRWNHPTRVRPVGRGGAVHTLHPDTGETFCGAPAGRRLTEADPSWHAPFCRACLNAHSAFTYREQYAAHWGAPTPDTTTGDRA